jgi:hypothetical protein
MWELSQSRKGMRTRRQTNETKVSIVHYVFFGD